MSQPSWAAWIEICQNSFLLPALRSQPTRAAWIEILLIMKSSIGNNVAAHSGCVD